MILSGSQSSKILYLDAAAHKDPYAKSVTLCRPLTLDPNTAKTTAAINVGGVDELAMPPR
jgi:hypothetical protein